MEIKMKIVTILGDRPQFIKATLLSKELRKKNHEIIISTGQRCNAETPDILFNQIPYMNIILKFQMNFKNDSFCYKAY
jgi:UDP-N-acetylglucosamine 2-epimerase